MTEWRNKHMDEPPLEADHGDQLLVDREAQEALRAAYTEATREVARLQARVAALEAALRKFGEHRWGCLKAKPCSCGLHASLGIDQALIPDAGGA